MSRSDLIPYAALVFRLSLGALFIAHGSLKVLVFKPSGTAAYFRSLGLPRFVGYLTMAAELGGGILLILGIATGLVSLALVPLILGTIFMVHGSNGWLFTNEGGGWEFPAFWTAALLVQVLLGVARFPSVMPLELGGSNFGSRPDLKWNRNAVMRSRVSVRGAASNRRPYRGEFVAIILLGGMRLGSQPEH